MACLLHTPSFWCSGCCRTHRPRPSIFGRCQTRITNLRPVSPSTVSGIYKYNKVLYFLSNHTSHRILIKPNYLSLFRIRILMCWLGRTNNLDLFLLCQHFNWPHHKFFGLFFLATFLYVRKTNKKSPIMFFIIKNNSYNNSFAGIKKISDLFINFNQFQWMLPRPS